VCTPGATGPVTAWPTEPPDRGALNDRATTAASFRHSLDPVNRTSQTQNISHSPHASRAHTVASRPAHASWVMMVTPRREASTCGHDRIDVPPAVALTPKP